MVIVIIIIFIIIIIIYYYYYYFFSTLHYLTLQQGVLNDPKHSPSGFQESVKIELPSDSDGEDHEIRKRIKPEPESAEEVAGPSSKPDDDAKE